MTTPADRSEPRTDPAQVTEALPTAKRPEETQAYQGKPADDPAAIVSPAVAPGPLGLFGPYQLLEVVSQDEASTVYLAFEPALQRRVAIEVLSPQLSASAAARTRFIREARATAAIVHQYVVTVHAIHEGAQPYLVREFVPGVTLQGWLERAGPPEVPEVVRLALQLAEGLAAAHARGLCHGDLRPGCVLFDEKLNELKIACFGRGRVVNSASAAQSGTILGQPNYLSPEQANGAAADERSDLFSLGSVLYALCTGQPPFRAEDAPTVLRRILEDRPHPVSALTPDVPAWLSDLIGKLHAQDPAERYPSAQSVVAVLQDHQMQAQRLLSLPEPRASQTRVTAVGRWRVGWVFLGLVLLAGVGVAVSEVAGWTHWFRSPVSSPPTPVPETWVQLFNGKDLTGWKTHPKLPGNWGAENGVLIGRGPQASYLFTERADYENFHLRVEGKISKDGDSGLVFRCEYAFGTRWGTPFGYEANIIGGLSNSRHGELRIGDMRVVTPVKGLVAPDGWFTQEVIARNNRIVIKVNGETVVDHVDSGHYYQRGHLALQLWTKETVVQFRKVEIKELPPTPESEKPHVFARFGKDDPPLVKDAVPDDGGWKIVADGPRTVNLWQVKNPSLEPGQLLCRARLRAENLENGAYLSMSTHFSGLAGLWTWIISASNNDPWKQGEGLLYHARHDTRPQSIVVQLRINGKGTVWIRDVELVRCAVRFDTQEVEVTDPKRVQVRPLGTIPAHVGIIRTAAFAPTGDTLATVGDDQTVRLWTRQEAGWRQEKVFKGRGAMHRVAFSRDGKTLAAGGDWRELRLFQRADAGWRAGAILKGHSGSIGGVVFSADGKTLISVSFLWSASNHELKFWDVRAARESNSMPLEGKGGFHDLAISKDGKTLAGVGPGDFMVRLWSAETREELATLQGHTDRVQCVAFAPDDQTLATGSWDNTVKLWTREGDRWEERVTLRGHTGVIVTLAFGAGGKVLATSSFDGTSRLWDVATGKLLATLRGHLGEAYATAFSADGTLLATAGADGVMRFWEVR